MPCLGAAEVCGLGATVRVPSTFAIIACAYALSTLTDNWLIVAPVSQHKPLERALVEGVDRSRAAKEFLEHLMDLERSFEEKIRLAREQAAATGMTEKIDMLEEMAHTFYADLRTRMENFFRDDRRTPVTSRA